jgi:hypothetical protein
MSSRRERQTPLSQLADRLVIRHMQVSTPDVEVRRRALQDRTPEPRLGRRLRSVAIVGAGASAPLLGRGDELATSLEHEFAADAEGRQAELFRLQRVYGLDPRDFETRLAALSRTPDVTQHVRERIAASYAYRHPTILGYEVLAHLLKHRFLDAIISFNFDELLDQSLDDELGPHEYRRLVSDRDCVNVVDDPDASDYLPLYIKLHGTATEPDSLRFTREAYYSLPQDMMKVVRRVLDGEDCTIVNVGSAMTGFDLHRLLRIPEHLEVYDLSPVPLAAATQEVINAERRHPREDSYFEEEHRDDAVFALVEASDPGEEPRATCDEWLRRSVAELDRKCGRRDDTRRLASLVRFRSADRHEAIAEAFGANSTLSRWTRDPDTYRHEYVEYLRRRTIVELALSGAKARGLGQVSWLAIDRCGTYYELYRREGREVPKLTLSSWSELRSAAGLDENDSLPDVVESRRALCDPAAPPTLDDRGEWHLREFVPTKLARHVVNQIGAKQPQVRRLASALERLQSGSEVEIHATDDQVCSKTFDAPVVLPTVTALSVFTNALFDKVKKKDHVYISCETGEWLLEDTVLTELLLRHDHVEIITAFDLKFAELQARFGGRLQLRVLDPWRHNRHMTIVCDGDSPARAVYFARRLRTPLITPVYLKQASDAARVKRAFDLMRLEIEKSGPESQDPLQGRFDAGAARALIEEMLADATPEATIVQEMRRIGVPPRWVINQLARG